MQKIKLLYNPNSGLGNFSSHIDDLLLEFQPEYDFSINRIINYNLNNYFDKNINDEFDIIMVAGGDGTVNSVVSAMLKNEINLPLAVIPTGTVNDYASYFTMPKNFEKLYKIINERKTKLVDVGKVNNKYFINVCAGGFITTVPHKTDSKLKNKLGKVAYYLKGIQELPVFKSLPLHFTTNSEEFEEEIFMFMIVNSNRAGGFKNINPKNIINDGKFELIAIKYTKLYEMSNALIDIFINKKLTNKNIIYLKSDYYKIENLSKRYGDHTDIDGERGPNYPIQINVINKRLSVFTNNV